MNLRLAVVVMMLAVVALVIGGSSPFQLYAAPGASLESALQGAVAAADAANANTNASTKPIDRAAIANPVANPGDIRFVWFDVVIDAGDRSLAAYQVDIRPATGAALIAGVEGGRAAPFDHPPYYDPKALQSQRVILAAYSTAGVDVLPTGRVRVARVHVMVEGAENPTFTAKLTACADVAGRAIELAAVELIEGTP